MVKFEQGTRDLMDAVAAATKKGVTTVIGMYNFSLISILLCLYIMCKSLFTFCTIYLF